MQLEEEEWIQCTLINYERLQCISKVSSIECEDAVPKGNNYGSDITRLKLKLVLNSGEIEDRSLIFKLLPTTFNRRKAILESGAYMMEARMFLEVLPKMENHRRSKEMSGEPLAPVCYGVRNGCEGYLLEDLSASGFKLADRNLGLDLNHMLLAIDSLAKFHAVAAAVIEKGQIHVRDFNENVMEKVKDKMGPMFVENMKDFADEIEANWDPEWMPYAEKLRNLSETIMKQILDGLKRDETKFKTLNHGDFWLANMMFRRDPDGNPNGIRMIDFQVSYYSNPSFDLQYLLHTSSAEEVLDRKEELFLIYCKKLSKYLELFGYGGEKPTSQELKEVYDKSKAFGLAVGLVSRPVMMIPVDNIPDMEEFSKNLMEKRGIKFSSYSNKDERFRRILKKTLKYGSDIGLL